MEKSRSRSKEIVQSYAANTWLIGLLTEGLSHGESLLQPPFPTNCDNWILGHVLVSRNESLQLCGGDMWDDELIERYKSESKPIREGDEHIRHLDELLKDIEISQDLLANRLNATSENELNLIVETFRGEKPLWQHIHSLHWHETYHLGQLELLRSFILSLRENEV